LAVQPPPPPWLHATPRGGKGKARVDDKTIHKATRAARKVTPGGGEASDRARPEQAACHSEGQGGAAGGHDSQPPVLPAAGAAGKRKTVGLNASVAATLSAVQSLIDASSSSSSSDSIPTWWQHVLTTTIVHSIARLPVSKVSLRVRSPKP
jgi:hypothetical protein